VSKHRSKIESGLNEVNGRSVSQKAILFIYHSIFDGFNRRLQREFRALEKLGTKVYMLTCQSKAFDPSYLPDNVRIMPIPWRKYRILSRGEWIWNPLWYIRIRRMVNLLHPCLIFVREFFHLPVARLAAPRHIPVVLDMAENVPALRLVSHKTHCSLSRMIMWPARAKRIERLASRMADHIMVVTEEQRERLLAMGLPPDKVTVISSTPILDAMVPDLEWAGGVEVPKGYPVVSFVGGSGPHRGIDMLLRAVPMVVRYFPTARFVIVGDHLSREPSLKDLVKELGIKENVCFPGRVPYGQALKYMENCDIGVIPHRSNAHINTTIPNKLFDYMFFGKPLVVSDARPLARIINEIGCGYVYPDPDSNRLSEAVIQLAKRPDRETIGLRGRLAVLRKYNWDLEEKKLLSLIKELIG